MSAVDYYGRVRDQYSNGYPGQGAAQYGGDPGADSHYATSHQSEYLGGHDSSPFSHPAHADAEAHCNKLRQEAQSAFQSGHHAEGAKFNQQASEYIFRENNAPGRVAEDTIDLHGQHKVEAVKIVEERIEAGRARNEDHLHVIVGKGNHSINRVAVLKPAIEELCTQQGLEWRLEHNEGRIFINLRGHATGGMPAPGNVGGYTPQQQPHYGGGQQHQNQQQHGGGGHNGKPQHDFNINDAKQAVGILTKVYRACCTVM